MISRLLSALLITVFTSLFMFLTFSLIVKIATGLQDHSRSFSYKIKIMRLLSKL